MMDLCCHCYGDCYDEDTLFTRRCRHCHGTGFCDCDEDDDDPQADLGDDEEEDQ